VDSNHRSRSYDRVSAVSAVAEGRCRTDKLGVI
jgi:hypothetical protein